MHREFWLLIFIVGKMKKTAVVLVLMLLSAGCQNYRGKLDQDEWRASLRCWYLRDLKPVTKDSLAYIRNRSENGDLLCRRILGQMYEEGLGMPVDLAKARAAYLSIAEVDKAAYMQLGRMAEKGIGEPVDFAKARRLYEQSGAYEDNKLAAVRLAGLMEVGKGGPRDSKGALALYLKWLERYQDDAWKGVQRLRNEGAVLDAEQIALYNKVWSKLVKSTLTRHMHRAKRTLSKEFSPNESLKPIKLQFELSTGSSVPNVKMLEGSGDSAFDAAVLQEMVLYRFPDEPILPSSQRTWRVLSIFGLDIW